MIEELFGIDRPVVQAPMAGVQGSALAIAVCEGGGLGSLPCAMLSTAALRAEIAAIRAATPRPFNLNYFCHAPPRPDPAREAHWRALLAPYYREAGLDPVPTSTAPSRKPFDEDAAALVEELRPPVVSFHFGLPAPALLARVRATGARILSSATTVDEARWLEARGVDAIVAQGLEAGGHRGHFLSRDLARQSGLFALLPQMAQAVGVPVIAAGGIADAHGVEAAFALGAAGVQVGTAYLRCPESTTSAAHRTALKDTDAPTALTNLFSGGAARGLVNRLMRELGPMLAEIPEFPLASGALAPLRAWAEAGGSGDFSPLWAGQNTLGCREIPAAALTRDLAPGLRLR